MRGILGVGAAAVLVSLAIAAPGCTPTSRVVPAPTATASAMPGPASAESSAAANGLAAVVQQDLLQAWGGRLPASEPTGKLDLSGREVFVAAITSATANPPSVTFDVYTYVGNGSETSPFAVNRYRRSQTARVSGNAPVVLQAASTLDSDAVYGDPDGVPVAVIPFAEFISRLQRGAGVGGDPELVGQLYWISAQDDSVSTIAQIYEP
jgi:hypothetical protein